MKNLLLNFTAFFLFTCVVGYGQDTSEFFTKADTFFSKYVKNGKVNYKGLKENATDLNELLVLAKGISVSKSKSKEYQAFWINGYNLSVIEGIVANYPIKSPLDKAGFFDKIKYDIGGEKITLNDIENKLLRGNFPDEARFHFVLVCAGLGCPPIISEAYLPTTLEAQLERQTRLALNDNSFIQVAKNKVKLSQIFEWYKGDFIKGGNNLVDFVNQYRTEKLPKGTKVSYYPYDWTLNAIN
ncbi:DUF547 domain-containing protein [Spongiimicrobium sp. 3-5]|uniref:DUF547 domain-containing protein n=1 Tax=Spongiimicrobium sp. 3-5 TaxID=3332596 RepID=UPI00397EE46B